MKFDGNMTESEQRKKIIEDTECNMFVEAGAGAGKTSIVVERICRQLEKTDIEPEQIVVITFTNAAVNELQVRIRQKLSERIREIRQTIAADGLSDEGDTERCLRRLEDAYGRLDLMQISTIHSFCLTLLRQRGMDIGLGLDISVMEEEEAKTQAVQFFAEYYNRHPDERLAEELGKDAYGPLKETFLSVCEKRKGRLVYTEPSEDFREVIQEQADSLIRKLMFCLIREFSQMESPGDEYDITAVKEEWFLSGIKKEIHKYLYDREKIFLNKLLDILSKMINSASKKELLKTGRDEKKKQIAEQIQMLSASMESEVKKLKNSYDRYIHGLIMQYVERARKEYFDSEKGNRLSNNELLYFASELVKKPEARRFFHKRYRCFYVDEFQDTDPLQTEVLHGLTDDGAGNMRDGALFIVGDPKQSIYAFRGADVSLYEEEKRRFEEAANGEVFSLTDNYRSAPEVIQWVNEQFGSRFPGYRDMNAAADREGRSDSDLNDKDALCGVYSVAAEEPGNYDREKDITLLCSLLQTLKAHGMIYDKKEKRMRSIIYSDIMVLTWNTTYMSEYIAEFSKAGIPVKMRGKYMPEKTGRLREFVILLKYLTDPFDPVNKACFLERTAGLNIGETDWKGIYEAGILDDLAREIRGMHPAAAVEAVAAHREIFYNGEIPAYEIEKSENALRQMLENVEGTKCGSLPELVEKLEDYLEKEQRYLLDTTPDRDAVRFMNLHQSKGLEAPVVIFADRRGDKHIGSGESGYTDRSGKEWEIYAPAACSVNQYSSKYVLPYTSEEKERAALREKEEFLRCQYVAATRAGEALVLMPPVTSKASGGRRAFEEFEDKVEQYISSGEAEKETIPETIIFSDCAYDKTGEQSGLTEQQKAPVYRKMSPSSEIHHISRGTEGAKTEDENRPAGNIFGTVMHRCFELVVNEWDEVHSMEKDILKAEISRIADFAVWEERDHIKDEEYTDYISYLKKVIQDFLADENLCDVIEQAEHIYTEFPFAYAEDNGEEKVLCEGVMDLVIHCQNGSWLIVDYKSNQRKGMAEEEFADRLMEEYKGQLAGYREALARFVHVPAEEIKAGIYYLDV